MMQKVELEIAFLQETSAKHNSFAVILVEKGGKRRLPVVIGSSEAQAIAVELDNFRPSRPLTHDLFVSFANTYSIGINEVLISELKNGVYYALLVCQQGDKIVEIDSRTSDALALAIRAKAPIFVNETVLEEAGFVFGGEENDEEGEELPAPSQKVERSLKSLDELKVLLDDAIENEDYEKAARLRDEIDKLKGSS